jgi:hypothetical protein
MFYSTRLCLSNCNVLWALIKQNMNFNIQQVVVFLYFTKIVLLKIIRPLSTHQHTKCHVPTLTGLSFASILKVWTSAILEQLKLQD